MPPDTPTHLPLPRAAGSPKHQNSISLELIKIFWSVWRFFTSEHSWTHIDYSWSPHIPPTHLPHPRAKETQIRKITITLEWIEIIPLCLKIWDPWTLLHTYRLHLTCRLGCPVVNGTFMFWTQKAHLFCSCDPPIKFIPIVALETIRPYLDWGLRGFLTS